jgi:ubiquinone/menaquinone biosynthesis C-methylase UbiE
MAISVDPENNETHALFDLADFRGQHVLEIGCGNGRVTWRYADRALHVTAIDPNGDRIARARQNLPNELNDRVDLHTIPFEEFAKSSKSSIFDSAIFSWSF